MYVCILFYAATLPFMTQNITVMHCRTWWPVQYMSLYQTSSNMYPFTISNDAHPPTYTDYA